MKNKKRNLWFREKLSPNEIHHHRIIKYIIKKKTKFQNAIIADSYSFGRCLILDGEMQSTEFDEFIYHEALTHPALIIHPNPLKVLILGGGEGATLREVLKYKSVKQVVIVDIDKEVLDFCKHYLTKWHKNSFDDARTKIIIDDARNYINETKEKYDIIISDLSSPIKFGPACLLYTIDFYKKILKLLTKRSIFVLQASSGNLIQIELHAILYSTLKRLFKVIYPYYAYVPSFDAPWAFLLCSNNKYNPLKFSAKAINLRLATKLVNNDLRFYDGETHVGLFHIPKNIREILSKEKRINADNKVFYYYK